MNFPIFDLHCDTAMKLRTNEVGLRKNSCHIDLERAGKYPGYAQCFACCSTTISEPNPVDKFEKLLSVIYRETTVNADIIRIAYCADEIEQNQNDGLMSAILTIEGPAGFGFDPALLEDLHNVGFLMSTLGWNEDNPLTGSHETGNGLTDLGKEYVRELQRLNMLVDVSHISDKGFWDIIEITESPIVASHSNSRAMCPHSRNITDDMFRAVCETGGIVGINLYPDFLGKNASLETVCSHILHFLEMDPLAEHIGLGGDLDGVDYLPTDFTGVEDYTKLAVKLESHGLSDEMIYKIFWKNASEVFHNAVHKHTK